MPRAHARGGRIAAFHTHDDLLCTRMYILPFAPGRMQAEAKQAEVRTSPFPHRAGRGFLTFQRCILVKNIRR